MRQDLYEQKSHRTTSGHKDGATLIDMEPGQGPDAASQWFDESSFVECHGVGQGENATVAHDPRRHPEEFCKAPWVQVIFPVVGTHRLAAASAILAIGTRDMMVWEDSVADLEFSNIGTLGRDDSNSFMADDGRCGRVLALNLLKV